MGILKIYFLRCWDHGESQSKNLSGGQSHPGQPGHQHTVWCKKQLEFLNQELLHHLPIDQKWSSALNSCNSDVWQASAFALHNAHALCTTKSALLLGMFAIQIVDKHHHYTPLCANYNSHYVHPCDIQSLCSQWLPI